MTGFHPLFNNIPRRCSNLRRPQTSFATDAREPRSGRSRSCFRKRRGARRGRRAGFGGVARIT